MAEQFCLRWNNHLSTLATVFESLLVSESLIDCTIAAEGKQINVHKMVLCACSPYFESLLCQAHDKHPIIFLKDVTYVEMKAMVDYMYKGEVNISQDQLDSFIKTAESLKIKGLTDQGGGSANNERDVGSTTPGGGRRRNKGGGQPQSPLVGTAPLREGSSSPPAVKRRRRLRQPVVEEGEGEGEAAIPPVAPPTPTPKVEPEEPQPSILMEPKTEQIEDVHDDIDLTLDDDEEEDYIPMDTKPGTSSYTQRSQQQPVHTSSGPPLDSSDLSNQDYAQWQMANNGSSNDEVFMAAQEAINQGNTQAYVCGDCGNMYKHSSSLMRHKKYECGKEPRFLCPHCGYRAKLKDRLTQHIKDLHLGGEKTFRCPMCPYTANRKAGLLLHITSKHPNAQL